MIRKLVVLALLISALCAHAADIDRKKLDASFAGREFDARLLEILPPDVDPCGENGEFHSFVYDGPMFRRPIAVEPGVLHEDGDFVFADLMCPVSSR